MNSLRSDLCRSAEKLEEMERVLEGAGKRRVLLLCHNNPDPDTIAGANGMSFLLNKKFNVRSVIGYGGVVTRAENKAMIQRLRIKTSRLTRLDPSQYFGVALIDAQPGTGNSLMDGKGERPLIVIDHHPLRKHSLKAHVHDIRPNYGATSTIVTEYIAAAGLVPSRSVANGLLYGIKTDTNALGRGASKQDFNAFIYLSPLTNPRVLGWIEKPTLSPEYFVDYQRGLARTLLYRDVAVSYLGKILSEAIIPELADLLLRIEGISWSLCMGENKNSMIISARSSSRTKKAGVVLRRLIGTSGSAGGHREMAGGQVPLGGMPAAERQDLPRRLINRFLKLLDRDGVTPKLMVESPET
ncbi:MAG: DHH family phosphoesterase [Desulfomonile tiedjei]|nr:DHH family phosphoesterase [Desulfomonile tiedjei]